MRGELAAELVTEAVGRAESVVEEILLLAVSSWRLCGFDSFDDNENSLTIRLFTHCEEVVRSTASYALFQVFWESPQPSGEMLAGVEDPSRAPRPDMLFSVGARKLLIEAKRLDGSSTRYRDYVEKGMKRFWDGRYRSDPGMMLGYLQGPSHESAVASINAAVVAAQPPTNEDDRRLKSLEVLEADLSKAASTYPLSHKLWHFAISV